MDNITALITGKDDKAACDKAREIASVSETSPVYYPYLEKFASLLTDEKSYVRSRAFILCCSQARWDKEGRIDKLLPSMLSLFHDPKPTVVRQCLNAIAGVAVFRPGLADEIRSEAKKINPDRYKDTMSPLIRSDIEKLLRLLDES